MIPKRSGKLQTYLVEYFTLINVYYLLQYHIILTPLSQTPLTTSRTTQLHT
jgi:hypothetical protein